MIGSKMTQVLKSLPLVMWGLFVSVLTAGPKEITAKVIEWATWAGYPGLPAYIAAQITPPP
jgi:hypothetical protein